MLRPHPSDRTLEKVQRALKALFSGANEKTLAAIKASKNLHEFAWAFQEQFYPSDDAFASDPADQGRKIHEEARERLSEHLKGEKDFSNIPAAVAYFFLVLVDFSADFSANADEEEKNDANADEEEKNDANADEGEKKDPMSLKLDVNNWDDVAQAILNAYEYCYTNSDYTLVAVDGEAEDPTPPFPTQDKEEPKKRERAQDDEDCGCEGKRKGERRCDRCQRLCCEGCICFSVSDSLGTRVCHACCTKEEECRVP